MGKSGGKLKAALQSQQNRFKAKEKLVQAAQNAEQKSRKGKNASSSKISHSISEGQSSKGKGKAKEKLTMSTSNSRRRPTIPFRPTDRILLIGEGNFSFARALVQDPPQELIHLPARNITATAYDTETQCYEKYPEAEGIIKLLREKGVEVRFGVDATRLEKSSFFKGRKWDKIVWNFPHAGKGITDQDRNILSNQVLLLEFLRSAAKMLVGGPIPNYMVKTKKKRTENDDDESDSPDEDEDITIDGDDQRTRQNNSSRSTAQTRGSILITLRNVPPYTLWDLPHLAKKPPPPTSGSTPPNPVYMQVRSFAFSRGAWKGYEHRMTKGERVHGTGKTGEGGEDRTWEFCLV